MTKKGNLPGEPRWKPQHRRQAFCCPFKLLAHPLSCIPCIYTSACQCIHAPYSIITIRENKLAYTPRSSTTNLSPHPSRARRPPLPPRLFSLTPPPIPHLPVTPKSSHSPCTPIFTPRPRCALYELDDGGENDKQIQERSSRLIRRASSKSENQTNSRISTVQTDRFEDPENDRI